MIKHLAIEIGNRFNTSIGKPGGNSLADLILLFINAAMVISGILVLILFVMGGFTMISSAGSSDPKGAARGKQTVTSAIVGFALIFMAYWIIRILEIITGSKFLTAPNLP